MRFIAVLLLVGCFVRELETKIGIPVVTDTEVTVETTEPMVVLQETTTTRRSFDYYDDPITEKAVDMPGTHSIICAKSIRPGTLYSISLTIHRPLVSQFDLDVSVTDGAQVVTTLKQKALNFQGLKKFDLEIPIDLTATSYTLQLIATGGISFKYSQALSVNSKQLSVFIQTDKALYKPGQTVLFRVVAINSQLRPIADAIDITITDNAGNRILQATDSNNKGVITKSLVLSEQTPIGTWQIKAVVKNLSTVKKFEVSEYVLPKFEVIIDLPKYFLVNTNNPSLQKDLIATVSAIYTYGKPVEGSATVIIKMQYFWGENPLSIEKNVQLVNGKAQLVLTTKDLKGIVLTGWDLSYSSFLFSASVLEEATGIVLTANNTISSTTQKLNLNFLDISPNNFKPDLSYTAFLQLTQTDGSPPTNEDLHLANGELRKVVIYVDCTFIPAITVVHQDPVQLVVTESGYMTFSTNIHPAADSCNLRAEFFSFETNTNATAYKNIQAFKTRDHQNIQVIFTNPEGIIKPNSVAHFLVKSNEEIDSFNYYVMGKGRIFISESVSGISSTIHNLDINITPELALDLAPEFKIIVTMVTAKKELVADSVSVTIVDYFANKVSLSFNKNSTLPGSSVSLNVNAHPNSFVGLLAVDQSVLLLGTGNDITKTMVMDDIKQYSEATFQVQPWLIDRKKKKVPTATLR